MNKKALIELLKSAGRYVWFGLLGLVGVALTALVASPEVITATVDIYGIKLPIGAIILAVVATIVKAIDRYKHLNKDIASNGIAPPFLQK